MKLRTSLSQIWFNIQYKLFPELEEEVGALSDKHKKLISILELIRIEHFVSNHNGFVGRPRKDRVAIARAFVAKVVLNLQFTNQLVDYLKSDKHLRLICGWESAKQVPDESTFSRAFEEFAHSQLPDRVHEALIKDMYEDEIIGHVIKDSTPIEAREKVVKKKKGLKNPKKMDGLEKAKSEKNRALKNRKLCLSMRCWRICQRTAI